MSRLRASVKRFVAGRQKQHQDLANEHRAALDAVQRDHDAQAAAHRAQTEQLQQRIVDLETEIIKVADGVDRDTHHEAQHRMNQLDSHATTNRNLSSQVNELKAENDRLRAKAKKMKLDWSKVDQSRQRFQQLQTEVTMMRDYNDKLQMENKNLRLMLEGAGHGTSRASHFSPDERDRSTALHRQAFQQWRATKVGDPYASSLPADSRSHASPYAASATSPRAGYHAASPPPF